MKTSLYQDLIAAGVECSNHESDLYFPITEQTREILRQHWNQKQSATTFKSNIDGKSMYEVPFAFDPFWEVKQK